MEEPGDGEWGAMGDVIQDRIDEGVEHQASLDEVLAEAVWAMESVKLAIQSAAVKSLGLGVEHGVVRQVLLQDPAYQRAVEFLASPLVAEWRGGLNGTNMDY